MKLHRHRTANSDAVGKSVSNWPKTRLPGTKRFKHLSNARPHELYFDCSGRLYVRVYACGGGSIFFVRSAHPKVSLVPLKEAVPSITSIDTGFTWENVPLQGACFYKNKGTGVVMLKGI